MNENLQVGFAVELHVASSDTAIQSVLFSEAQGRVVVGVACDKQEAVESLAKTFGIECRKIGITGGQQCKITINHQKVFEANLSEISKVYFYALEESMFGPKPEAKLIQPF
jgi:phosphoribosylformylglycinamidine (FGAM) synthase-like enzyme